MFDCKDKQGAQYFSKLSYEELVQQCKEDEKEKKIPSSPSLCSKFSKKILLEKYYYCRPEPKVNYYQENEEKWILANWMI